MRRRLAPRGLAPALLLGGLLPPLAGCGPDHWVRAERSLNWDSYLIFRAGLDDDSCLLLYVAEGFGYSNELVQPPLEDVEVVFPEVEGLRVFAAKLDVGADRCGAQYVTGNGFPEGSTPIEAGAGTLRFIESAREDGGTRVCDVEVKASLEGWSIDERVPITGLGLNCPIPEGPTFEVDKLGASSPRTRDDFLALRSWDSEREVCYGLDFQLFGVDELFEREGQELPPGWVLTDVHMTLFGSEASCRSGSWFDDYDAGLEPRWLWTDARDARGELRFESAQPWVNPFDDTPTPCVVSVDFTAEYDPFVYWSPTSLRFVAEDIPVAMTCADAKP